RVEALEDRQLLSAYITGQGDIAIRFEGDQHSATITDIMQNNVSVGYKVTFNTGEHQDYYRGTGSDNLRTNDIYWAPTTSGDGITNNANIGEPVVHPLQSASQLPADPQTGTPTNSNLIVNTTRTLNQYQSANASSASGQSVAVWTTQYSATATDVKAQ